MRAVEDFVSRASLEKVLKQDAGCTVCSHCEVAAFECWIFKINRTKSKTMNRRVLIGKLKDFDGGVRSLFELATDSCQNIYQTYTGDAPDLREIQTYPEWRVQMCFRNLKKHHRKRSRQKIIYIVCRPLDMEVSPLSSWPGNLWVATFSEWPWNFWKRLPSRRWIVNIDFIQILENCSC